ncbi:THO complex subunit 4-like [Sipha flava]|uniref:THO complex subunit 4-like n=1 Tax=Sipha flava TaxID=143950 RepID=A0A8B8GQ06_9HEMI|nr:THO complex subunit 4-like [Sipha flava]
MNVSLDELIKNKRSSPRGERRGGGRQGGSRSFGGRTSNFRSNGVGRSGGGPMRRSRSMARRSNGYTPYSKGDINASWTHEHILVIPIHMYE